MKVLILSVNPKNTPNLRLDEEMREIKEELVGSQIEIIVETAVQVEDLSLWLVRHNPEIVHFSGHGGGKYGLAFEDKNGHQQLVSTEALAGLFRMFTTNIKLIVLNACHSKEQAKEISQHIDSVIGMNQEIGDNAAIQYAKGFYRALAANKSIEFAHGFGIVQIQAMGIPGHLIPELLTKGEYSPDIPALNVKGKRSRIFISYTRGAEPDESVALAVHQALKDQYDVFLDQRAVVGTRWAESIEAELKQADFLIPFISDLSPSTGVVQETIEKAQNWRGEVQKPTILPICLASRKLVLADMDFYLNEDFFADWHSPADTPSLVEQLVQKLDHSTSSTSTSKLSEVVYADDLHIDRQADLYALKLIEYQDQPIVITAPYQFGKTFLLDRLKAKLEQSDKLVARLNFQELSQNQAALANADAFFREFCSLLTEQLELDDRIDEYWICNDPSKSCTRYLEQFLLIKLRKPMVVMIDDIHTIFNTDFCPNFFGMLRLWHNLKSGSKPRNLIWKELNLIVTTSTEPNELETSIHQSPLYNVITTIELSNLTENEVIELNRRYGSPLNFAQLQQLWSLLEGHIQLTKLALDSVRKKIFTPAQLFEFAMSYSNPFDHHLNRYYDKIMGEPELQQALIQVLQKNICKDRQAFSRLWRWGLIHRGATGQSAYLRCQLYAMYFGESL